MSRGRPDVTAEALRARLRAESRVTVDLDSDRSWLADISPRPAQLLSDMARRGLAHRIQRGRYVVNLNDREASEYPLLDALEPLADTLLEPLGVPYYLSWHTALFHYGLLEQHASRIFCAVPVRKRSAKFFGYEVRFVTLDRRKFFGIEPTTGYGGRVRVATAEKALLDSLEQPQYAAPFPVVIAAFDDAVTRGLVDARRLVEYALAYENQSLARRTGFLMERFGLAGSEPLRDHLGAAHLVSLDPSRHGRRGRETDRRWRLHYDKTLLLTARNLK